MIWKITTYPEHIRVEVAESTDWQEKIGKGRGCKEKREASTCSPRVDTGHQTGQPGKFSSTVQQTARRAAAWCWRRAGDGLQKGRGGRGRQEQGNGALPCLHCGGNVTACICQNLQDCNKVKKQAVMGEFPTGKFKRQRIYLTANLGICCPAYSPWNSLGIWDTDGPRPQESSSKHQHKRVNIASRSSACKWNAMQTRPLLTLREGS